MLMLCQAIPILVSWISAVLRSLFGRKEWPTFGGLSLVSQQHPVSLDTCLFGCNG